jgi:hypothetical protein
MKTIEEIIDNNEKEITEDLDVQYDRIIESLQKAKEEKLPIDEGILGSIVGGAAGLVFGPKIMLAVCSALGIDPRGSLGSLMTSRLIMTAVAGKIGARV